MFAFTCPVEGCMSRPSRHCPQVTSGAFDHWQASKTSNGISCHIIKEGLHGKQGCERPRQTFSEQDLCAGTCIKAFQNIYVSRESIDKERNNAKAPGGTQSVSQMIAARCERSSHLAI